ncbi:MAG TPA: DoxX family protein, partial [Vicinamibacterales bacterium]|nr:DoxX family protein [Vicinamibacterales bacterium]
ARRAGPPDLSRDPASPAVIDRCITTFVDRLYSVMQTVPIVLSVLLALVFLAAGLPKIAGPMAGQRRADIARFGLPPGVTPAIGLIEVATAGVLIAAVAAGNPNLARLGAALLVVTMLGALFAHVRVHDSVAHTAVPAVLGVLAVVTLLIAG